jgi:hypothetical protein
VDYSTNGNALPAIALELANEVDDLLQLLALISANIASDRIWP